MAKSKSTAKNNRFARLWKTRERAALRNRRRNANKLRLEQLETRRLLAALVLDIPGINGDAAGVGATATDIQLSEFSWGFSRGTVGANSKLSDPIVFSDLQFKKQVDLASNDLYAQANFAPIYSTATRLRVIDDVVTPGKNQLSFELGSARLSSFGTDGGVETGSLSFAKVDFNESLATINAVTNRTASWDLLSGAVANSAIVGPGNIDNSKNNQPSENPLNIETVLEIGGQKLLIDDFSWTARAGGDVLALPGSLTKAKGGAFQITRDVDTATAGLLGSAAAGSILGKVTITDRVNFLGTNKVFMQWNLYDAFVSDFGLSAHVSELPTNKLGLSYSKIELTVTELEGKAAGNTLTTTWDEAGNVVTPATTFGTADPSTADTAQVASYLDFGTLGRVRYESIDWLVSKPTTISKESGITQAKTKVGAMEVKLAAGPSTPALLGSLAKLTVLPTIAAKEQNTVALTSALNTFTLTNAAVTEFEISSKGLELPVVKFDLDFQNFAEVYNDRKLPLITSGNFNEVTGSSTGVLSFGAQNAEVADRLFELEITEDGITSKIPVTSAKWSASREFLPTSQGGATLGGAVGPLSAGTFDLTIPRGIHSPGLFNAAARGTTIDKAVIKRYEEVLGEERVELYQWELTDAFLTDFASYMLPGNQANEIDRISFNPSKIALKTPAKTDPVTGKVTQTADFAEFNFFTEKNAVLGGQFQNQLTGDITAAAILQMKIDGRGVIAIDSYSWGAKLPVDAITKTGTRPLGDPNASALTVNVDGLPSAPMLGEVIRGKSSLTTKLALPSGKEAENPDYRIELTNNFATAYAYQDAITSTWASNSLSLTPTERARLDFARSTPTGLGTPRSVNWDLNVDSNTTQTGGFGGFQFAPDSGPPMVLEFLDGTTSGQVEVDGYSFVTKNSVEQAVGKFGSPTPLAPRGISVPGSFRISTRMDETTPGLFAAIALKTKLPEVKIIERAMVIGGSSELLPVREWTLRDVYINDLANAANAGDSEARIGTINLALSPGSAESKLITYDAAGKAASASRSVDFVTPPTPIPLGTIAAISTDPNRLIELPTRFTDQEATSTLRYTSTVVSGANLFDSVSVNSTNRLVLNYKAGQSGLGQVRVDAMDSFGLVGSLLVNVAVDVDGITAAPAGTNLTVTATEDTAYTITAADFGFTDPNDFPANTFTAVTVFSLPSKGALTLNNVAVTANQLIPIASIDAGQLRYTPLPNENGNTYASFQFQVRDNGVTSNVDLSPNTLTFNVAPGNDAPVMAAGSAFVTMPAVVEDTSGSAGVLLLDLAPLISDIDVGALKGIAVISANNTNGNWQYAIDGTSWLNFGSVSNSAGRLLALDAVTRIRFAPNANFSTPVGTAGVELSFVAWDRTVGLVGETTEVPTLGGRGGTTAFSESPGVYTQFVTPVNDAPTLLPTTVDLTVVNEDTPNPAGTLVSALLSGVSDADANSLNGMAVQSVQNLDGVWEYNLDNGTSWQPFGAVTSATARLLPSTARVRFVPIANFAGVRSIQFSAWDQTTGVAAGTTDLSLPPASGGTTAFSTAVALAQQTVRAVNDAPTIVMQNIATIAMGSSLVFSNAPNSPIRIADIDAADSPIQAAFLATNGLFTLSRLTGLTLTAGTNGSAAFTVRGTLAAINAALQFSSFTPNAGFLGLAQLRLNVSDLGNTGGGPLTAARTALITVQPISLGALTAANPTVIARGSLTASFTAGLVYSFSIGATTDVRVALSGLTSTANMTLLNSAGQNLGQTALFGSVSRTILATALPAGTYTLNVLPSGTATEFDLAVSIAATSDDLIVNARELGTLNAARPTVRVFDSVNGTGDRQDYHKFTNAVAGPLRVNLSSLSDDYDLQLLNANGVIISSSVLTGTRIETIARSNLPAGTFFVRVFALPNRTLSSYDLSVTVASNSDDSISRPLALGTLDAANSPVLRTAGAVAPSTDIQDYYSFVVAAPTDVRINLSGLSTDTDINLLDSFGRALASGTNGGNSIENIFAGNLAAGTYYVRASLFALFSTNYELSIAMNPATDDLISNAVSLGSLSPTTPTLQRTGDVNSASDRVDYYRFTLGSTSDVRVNLNGMSGDADVTLEDSFGRLIANSLLGGNVIDNLNATALVAGTYHIRVNTAFATTNYTLAVSQTPASDDLISNATVLSGLTSGTLPTVRTTSSAGGSDIQDYYRFQLNTAGNLRLNLSGMTADLDVEVLDQFGQLIVFGAQSGNTSERVTTPVLPIGAYYVRVFQLSGATSNYVLEITTAFNGDDVVLSGRPLGTLASAALTASGSVGGTADIQDYFSFGLTSTRSVRFQLTGLTADIDLQVLDNFGRVIQSGTSGSTSTEDLTVNGLVAGFYTIRVFPFNAAVSSYTLSVTGVTAPAMPAAMSAVMPAAMPAGVTNADAVSVKTKASLSAASVDEAFNQERTNTPSSSNLDANGDGIVSPLDALLVMNALQARSNGTVRPDNARLDINGDGQLTPLDALLVMNFLKNRQAASDKVDDRTRID